MYHKELNDEQLQRLHDCKSYAERLIVIKELYPVIPDTTQRFMAKDKEPWTALGFMHNYQRIYRNKRLKNLENKRKIVAKEAALTEKVETAVTRSVKAMSRRKHNIEKMQQEKERMIPWAETQMREIRANPPVYEGMTVLDQIKAMKELYEMAEIFSGKIEVVEKTEGLDQDADTFFKNIMGKINETNGKEAPESTDVLEKQLISLEDYESELQKAE